MKTTLYVLVTFCAIGCAQEAANTYALNDAGETETTGSVDTGTTDTGSVGIDPIDISTTDTGSADTGSADTGSADISSVDTSTPDTGSVDTIFGDTTPSDTGTTDTGSVDTGPVDTDPTDTESVDTGSADTSSGDTAKDCNWSCMTSNDCYISGGSGDGGSYGCRKYKKVCCIPPPPNDCAGECLYQHECERDGGVINSEESLECAYSGKLCCEFPVIDTAWVIDTESEIDTGPLDTGSVIDTGSVPWDTGTGSEDTETVSTDTGPDLGPYCHERPAGHPDDEWINCGHNPYINGDKVCCSYEVYGWWTSVGIDNIRCLPISSAVFGNYQALLWFETPEVNTYEEAQKECSKRGWRLADPGELDKVLPCNQLSTVEYCLTVYSMVWSRSRDGVETNISNCTPSNHWYHVDGIVSPPLRGICL